MSFIKIDERFNEIIESFFEGTEGNYINKEYIGGETSVIETNPFRIKKFIIELYELNPFYIKFIRQITLNYWKGNEFRGSGGDRSYIILNKEFAKKIKIKGFFKWIDRAWGDARADLQYDLSPLKGGEKYE